MTVHTMDTTSMLTDAVRDWAGTLVFDANKDTLDNPDMIKAGLEERGGSKVLIYGASGFTGHLIARFGAERIIGSGLVILAGAGAVAASADGAPRVAERIPVQGMRKTIAARLSESKQTIPHYRVSVDIEIDSLLQQRAYMNGELGHELSVNDFVIKACAGALAQVPELKVAARTSSFAFKNKNINVREIAQALGGAPLGPEDSSNFSAGVVWDVTDNLNFTLDFYQIEIDDRIVLSENIRGAAVRELLRQLGSHTSRLNPAWYGLSFALGAIAGAVGDEVSLGFVAATEERVCNHLKDHLKQLPEDDRKSRLILQQMLEDEQRHGDNALEAGGTAVDWNDDGQLVGLRYGPWKVVFMEQRAKQLACWAEPCYRYCEQHNLEFTGHYWEHGWPGAGHGGDNMAMYAWHQRPAIDTLFNQYSEKPDAQFGNVRAVMELASAADQLGRERTLCEAYGGSGWDARFEDFKRIGDWLQVLGVNTINAAAWAYCAVSGS